MNRSALWLVSAFSSLALLASTASSEETIGTLTLDSLSFISFGDQEVLPLPAGATVRFRFGSKASDGSIPFTIEPSDLSIPPVPSADGTLEYSIGSTASGTMRPAEGGRIIEFSADVNAKLLRPDGSGGTMVYSMPFSTESASASNLAKTQTIEVTGMRVIEGTWYAQIVGATVNKRNAYPKPGSAVYTVLSGRFDRIP